MVILILSGLCDWSVALDISQRITVKERCSKEKREVFMWDPKVIDRSLKLIPGPWSWIAVQSGIQLQEKSLKVGSPSCHMGRLFGILKSTNLTNHKFTIHPGSSRSTTLDSIMNSLLKIPANWCASPWGQIGRPWSEHPTFRPKQKKSRHTPSFFIFTSFNVFLEKN